MCRIFAILLALLASNLALAEGVTSPYPSLPSTTFAVAASGGNYTSIRSAYAAFTRNNVLPIANINLSVAAGTYTDTVPLTITSRFGGIFSITGADTISHNLTSIVSSSGSAGAYSIVLQLDSVSGMTANQDYIVISNASAGTNPTYMDGVFPVTAVNSGASQITVTSLSRAAVAPSGSVAAAVTDIPTVLKWTGVTGIQVYGQSALQIDKVIIACDNSANQFGIDEEDVSRLFVPHILGIYNCGTGGVVVNYNSQLNGGGSGATVAVSGGTNPVFAWGGGQIQMAGASLVATGGTGSASGSNANILATSGAYIAVGPGGASGGAADGMLATTGGRITGSSMFSTGNTLSGLHAYNYGVVYGSGSTTEANNGSADSIPWDVSSSQINFNQSFIMGFPDGDTSSFCSGLNACASQTTASSGQNVEYGGSAGQFISSGENTTAFGYTTCRGTNGTPITGNNNSCFGDQAGTNLQGTAAQNSIFGSFAGALATTAQSTVMDGFQACEALTTGTNDICIGNQVGKTTLSTGLRDILLGTASNCDTASSGTNDTFLLCASTGSTPLVQANLTASNPSYTINGIVAVSSPFSPTCGTGCSSVTGTDQKFVVTPGTAQTSVVVNFGHTWSTTPNCTLSSSQNASVIDVSAISASSITFGASIAVTGGSIYALCF